MKFGELKEKGLEYADAHNLGGRRMADYLISEFDKRYPKELYHEKAFLERSADEFMQHCETFGMGVDESEKVD